MVKEAYSKVIRYGVGVVDQVLPALELLPIDCARRGCECG